MLTWRFYVYALWLVFHAVTCALVFVVLTNGVNTDTDTDRSLLAFAALSLFGLVWTAVDYVAYRSRDSKAEEREALVKPGDERSA